MTVSTDNGGADQMKATDPAPDPHSAALISERKQAVRQAIDSLAPRQKVALVLSYYDGLSYSDIAEIMKCSIGTVKTHMSRALRSLARLLPEPQGEKA